MDNIRILIELIRKICLKLIKRQSFLAEVVSVDRANDTCEVKTDSGLKIFGVRLKAEVDDLQSKVVVYPKAGSLVMCSLVENDPNEAFVSKYGEIDEVVLDVPKVTINGGKLGGMGKTEIIAARINRLELALEQLQAVFNTHTHIVSSPIAPVGAFYVGTATPPPMPSAIVLMPKTMQDDISNDKITH